MRNRLLIAGAALLIGAAPPDPEPTAAGPSPAAPACADVAGAFCVDAGTADRGLVITRTARIRFETQADQLRLTIEDRGSDATTVLDLPYAKGARKEVAGGGG